MAYDEYPLTVKIIKNQPHGAMLEKGQICKAKIDPRDTENGLLVFDEESHLWPWRIDVDEVKVINNG